MIEGSLLQFPDLYFVFITDDSQNFNELVQNVKVGDRQYHYKVIQSNQANVIDFDDELILFLKSIPKRIMAISCGSGANSINSLSRIQFEDYLSPYEDLFYRVNPRYIPINSEVKFQVFFVKIKFKIFLLAFLYLVYRSGLWKFHSMFL